MNKNNDIKPSIQEYEISENDNKSIPIMSGKFPLKFDLRNQHRVTAERISDCASCWATAAAFALETSAISSKGLQKFSENHIQKTMSFCHWGAPPLSSVNYFTSWLGPILYEDHTLNKNKSELKQKENSELHIQEVIFVPHRKSAIDNDQIKNFLMNYGGIDVSVSKMGTNRSNKNMYYWPDNNPCHSVVIIGWDNSIKKEMFSCTFPDSNGKKIKYIPTGDGAFIVKGNEGFCYYISYYDGTIGYQEMQIYLTEPIHNFNNIYQHEINSIERSSYKHVANIFSSSDKPEYLEAIGFLQFNTDSNPGYEIAIHLDPHDSPICTGKDPILSFQIHFSYTGYHTIRLPKKLKLLSKQRFSIILSHINKVKGVQIAMEYDKNKNIKSIIPGQSFCSNAIHPEKKDWFDMMDSNEIIKGNFCIKAYTSFEQHQKQKVQEMDTGFSIKKFNLLKWKIPTYIFKTRYLHITSTLPSANKQINYLGVNTITVDFDQLITKGEEFYAIRVFSEYEVKTVYCTIKEKRLTISTTTPLDPLENILGGTLWNVIIPSKAVTNNLGTGIKQPYSFSFVTIGVN